jgi:hypothetical protein
MFVSASASLLEALECIQILAMSINLRVGDRDRRAEVTLFAGPWSSVAQW